MKLEVGGKVFYIFCFPVAKFIVIGIELNQLYSSWVYFARDTHWEVISLSSPMSFLMLFSPHVLLRAGGGVW